MITPKKPKPRTIAELHKQFLKTGRPILVKKGKLAGRLKIGR